MTHLLKLEWLKMKDYVLFRIVAISYVVLLPAALFVGKKIPELKGEAFNPQVIFFNFPSVWDWLGYIGNWLVFFMLGFMAVMLITNEHTYRTLRQNVITGLQRQAFFWSKVQFMAVVSLAATVYYALCALVIGSRLSVGSGSSQAADSVTAHSPTSLLRVLFMMFSLLCVKGSI